jgi:succinoglycan biosynthesis transport protein ExoP
MTDTALTQQGTPDDELDLTRLLALVWRGKWIILACIAVAFALATFYIREVAVPRYAATTRLVIEAQDRNVVDIESVVSGMSTSTTSINTELSIITSRGMIEKLVRDLELYKDPEFNNAIAQPPRYSRGWIRQQIRALITGETPQVPDQTVEEAVQSSIGRTARAVRATSVSSTLLIDITVTTENRRKSAVIANRLAELYIDAQVENKFNAVEYAIEWLTERVTELERELRDRQSQLDEVRSGASLVGQETLEQMTIRSVELRNRIQNLSSSIEERQARIARAKTLRDTGGGEELVDLFDDRTLSAISADAGAELGNERFSDRVDLLIAQEEQGVARLISQRDVFQESIERLNAELSQQTEALKQVEEMSRNIQASQTLYETLLSRLKETSLQIGLQQADSRILSEAPSGRQVAPQARRLTALSIVFGFLVGVGLVLLRQFTQRGIKTGSELEAVTGQNVIGQIRSRR